MDISSMSETDMILLAIEYVSKGLDIPKILKDGIDPIALSDIEAVGELHDRRAVKANVTGWSSISA